MKKYIVVFGIISLVVVTAPTLAGNQQSAHLSTPGTERVLFLPPQAIENSPVIRLGAAFDPGSNSMVEGYAIIHYAKGGEKGPPEGKGGKGENQCHAFLAKDTKWKVVEDYMVDTTGSGLNDLFIRGNFASNIDKWEAAASADILGNEIAGIVDGADTISPDDKNEVLFGSLDQGIIGVTVVWGVFSGKPSNRRLVEWDQVYNTYYQWSDSGEANKMDLENIATHELGHSVGLADLYDADCGEETMYGYSTEGEIKKRDLNTGDIAGIAKLYQ